MVSDIRWNSCRVNVVVFVWMLDLEPVCPLDKWYCSMTKEKWAFLSASWPILITMPNNRYQINVFLLSMGIDSTHISWLISGTTAVNFSLSSSFPLLLSCPLSVSLLNFPSASSPWKPEFWCFKNKFIVWSTLRCFNGMFALHKNIICIYFVQT